MAHLRECFTGKGSSEAQMSDMIRFRQEWMSTQGTPRPPFNLVAVTTLTLPLSLALDAALASRLKPDRNPTEGKKIGFSPHDKGSRP